MNSQEQQGFARLAEHVFLDSMALRCEVTEHSVQIKAGSEKEKESLEFKMNVSGSNSKGQKAVEIAQVLSLSGYAPC